MNGRVGVVMTMGALHEGHASLLRTARQDADYLLATIFVNPLQFGPNEDFLRYPRTFEEDLEILREHGADVVFAPAATEIYPDGAPKVRVAPGPLGTILEGAHRPGHFDGVLTVVLKLLNLTRATAAYFGEKDYQQLDPDPVDGGRAERADRHRRRAHGPRAGRTRAVQPQPLSVRCGSDRRAHPVARIEGRCGGGEPGRRLPSSPLPALSSPITTGWNSTTSSSPTPSSDRPPESGPARLLVAAKVGGTRLIDNVGLLLEKP